MQDEPVEGQRRVEGEGVVGDAGDAEQPFFAAATPVRKTAAVLLRAEPQLPRQDVTVSRGRQDQVSMLKNFLRP